MTEAEALKPKKSVALSGVTAGNTALCTVGRTGNDLHYRGYDILDIADRLRVRGDRPPADPRQLAQRAPSSPPTRTKLKSLRGLPATVRSALELLPALQPSDGCAAHRRFGAGLHAAGEGGSRRPPARATSPTG